jgi:beta-glucosidase
MFDLPEQSRWASLGREVINCEKHKKLALEAAQKSIVLLKNEGNLLPLDDSAKRIAVIGPGAANIHTLLANYYGVSPQLITPLEGLGEKIRDKHAINLEYRQACLQYQRNHPSNVGFGSANPPDLIIAVFGLDNAMEGEEGDAIASDSNGDREYIELPPWQLEYLRSVKKSGKPVILVLTGGSAIAVPEDIADAILFAWYPGEQGGRALADIIFGDVNPSGKLPITFPASTAQLPPYEDYNMKGRTYRYMTEKPLWPFGFGLSYTTFRFDSIEASSPKIEKGGSVKIKASLTNTGKRDAEEVVQFYIIRDERKEEEPQSSLKGFKRVLVPAEKTVNVEIDIPASAFETINAEGQSFLLPGSYTVIAADAAPLPVAVEKGAAKPVSVKVSV